jgi:GNAT superfamily N-acetyltransferase
MSITYKTEINVTDYALLEAAVGWDFNVEQFEACIKGSACIIAAYDVSDSGVDNAVNCESDKNGDDIGEKTAKIIGAARIIWDGGDDAVLRDLVVLPEYQGRGIGKELVTRVINYLKNAIRPGWDINLDLLAESGKDGFYEKQGFHSLGALNNGMTYMRMKIERAISIS